MADGIDPTEKDPLTPKGGDDGVDDDDIDLAKIPWDPEESDRIPPFQPPAGGESIPMTERTRLTPEKQGTSSREGFNLGFTTQDSYVKRELEKEFPNMSITEIEFKTVNAPKSGGSVIEVKYHSSNKWYRLFTKSKGDAQKTLNTKLPKKISDALGESSAEKSAAEANTDLRDTQRQLDEAQQREESLNALAQETQKRQRDETQLEQNKQRIENMANEGGTKMEKQMEIDRLERENAKLKRDIDASKKKEKEYAKEKDKIAKEVERLKRQYEIQRQKRDTAEANLNKTKPLDELEREREESLRKLEEYREIMNDKDATPQQRMVAGVRFSEITDELARMSPQIQEKEQELPLRERVKNIFKKYGWTLQAVALAVGIVLSALALAATNGLKASTKAIGNGLGAIGKKLGSLLPGLIGSIVSYIFKAAGSVLSFLGEHAWLLILAVVAFFMERMLKRRRR